MIFYAVTRRHAYTITSFLKEQGPELKGSVRLVRYEWLPRRRKKPATWIFSDVDRLSYRKASAAARLWADLDGSGSGNRLLNHPFRSMRRYRLLRTLQARGINSYNVYRLDEAREPRRYPVFLRREQGHDGPKTSLLHTPEALAAAVHDLETIDGKLVVEFVDIGDEGGIIRKYSAFRIADRIVPRHLFFSREWALKNADLTDDEHLEEELCYVRDNPHADRLMEIFELARIEYGRIDYSMLGDRIEVWEINTNPMIVSENSLQLPARREVTQIASRNLIEAFRAAGA